MLVIGFANVYYTLWEVTSETRRTASEVYNIKHFNYIKNVSKSFDKVKELYPAAPYDEFLKGKSASFVHTEKIEQPEDCFNFGKYVGNKISESTDYSYMMWYYNNCNDPKRQALIKPILEEQGYGLYRNEIVNPSYYKEILAQEEEAKEWKERINAENIEFDCNQNPCYDGKIFIGPVTFIFPEVKECYYQGYSYFLPILNGKAKRIKNKHIKVTKFKVLDFDNLEVIILDFEIIK